MSDSPHCNTGKKNIEPGWIQTHRSAMLLEQFFLITEFPEICGHFYFYNVSEQKAVIGLCPGLIVVWVIHDLSPLDLP